MSTHFPTPLTQQQGLDQSKASEVFWHDAEGGARFWGLQVEGGP